MQGEAVTAHSRRTRSSPNVEAMTRAVTTLGVEVVKSGVRARVWAPDAKRVAFAAEDGNETPLIRATEGYFVGDIPGVRAGTRYRFRVDSRLLPDPASRRQPEGPEGPSEVVDTQAFAWTDRRWTGPTSEAPVLYELHIGTFTPEGTWDSTVDQLPRLADLGVEVLELMPVADFPGRFGWGYDGVCHFAPYHGYGPPDAMRRFVDRAHGLGMGVILDVVYCHVGPRGSVLKDYSENYFSTRHKSEWGVGLAFDEPHSRAVRVFVLANVRHWIAEYHLDGLRLDATQDVFDESPTNILAEIAREARHAAGRRRVLVIGENEPQRNVLLRSFEDGGYGFDAVWADDFHHAARVAATGRREAYYSDYWGTPQELISVLKRGYLYQGQRNNRQGKTRGTSTRGMAPSRFVFYLQNHDQVANFGLGQRLHELTSPGRLRALTALLLLAPCSPLLFQGQEWAASNPFRYFGDLDRQLMKEIDAGRRDFLKQFPSLSRDPMRSLLPRANDETSFRACRLDAAEAESGRHAEMVRLHRDLIRLRRSEPIWTSASARIEFDGAVVGPEALALRWFGQKNEEDRLLIVNLGTDLAYDPAPEPLLAPPEDMFWDLAWSSESPEYGGIGPYPVDTTRSWYLMGHAASVFRPAPATHPETDED